MDFFISPDHYLESSLDHSSFKELKDYFDACIKLDGVRKRAYLKLSWNFADNTLNPTKDQSYFQTSYSNLLDGGKVRYFAPIDREILKLHIIKNMFNVNMDKVKSILGKKSGIVTIGVHFVQYIASEGSASYASPPWLHLDDEPIVFVHLIEISSNAIGGDNIIADIDTQEIKNVIRLENPFDTLLLTRDYYHAVTPLGSKKGIATRNIILFTVEPKKTQIEFRSCKY